MNLLMVIAVVGAIGIGAWFEAATVSFFFALALALEAWSLGRARRAVAALMELAPSTARIRLEDGTERDVTAVSPPAKVRSIRHRSPAKAFPSSNPRAMRCLPAPSTARVPSMS
jgi:hypothetical protein